MTNVASQRDVGSLLAARFSSAGTDVTAGGSGDATEVDGAYIDATDFESCKVIIAYTATLAENDTISIAANLQDATDIAGTGVADFGTALASTIQATGGSGGSTETGVVELDLDLSASRGFIRLQFTPDMSAASIDVAELASVIVLGGHDTYPQTASAI